MKTKLIIIFSSWILFLNNYVYGSELGFTSKTIFRKVMADNSAVRALDIKVEKIIEQEVDQVVKSTGIIEEIPKNHFDVNCPVQGVVSSVPVDLGDIVQIDQPLAVIKSTEIAKLVSEINQFKAEVELTRSEYERKKLLFEEEISPKKDFEVAKSLLATAEAKLHAAEDNFKIITNSSDVSTQGEFTVSSQKSGTIVERNISLGQVVNSNQILFRGVDLSTVWASADIFQKDIGKISLGQNAQVIIDGIPDKIFKGKLTYIGSIINKDTRVLPVKVTLANTNGLLKPGAFIQLEIITGRKMKSIIIPESTLVQSENEDTKDKHEHFVYVKNENSFEPRKILVEPHDSKTVLVISGLMDGEFIVTQGSYQLQYGKDKNKEDEEKGSGFNLLQIVISIFLILLGVFFFLKRKKKINLS